MAGTKVQTEYEPRIEDARVRLDSAWSQTAAAKEQVDLATKVLVHPAGPAAMLALHGGDPVAAADHVGSILADLAILSDKAKEVAAEAKAIDKACEVWDLATRKRVYADLFDMAEDERKRRAEKQKSLFGADRGAQTPREAAIAKAPAVAKGTDWRFLRAFTEDGREMRGPERLLALRQMSEGNSDLWLAPGGVGILIGGSINPGLTFDWDGIAKAAGQERVSLETDEWHKHAAALGLLRTSRKIECSSALTEAEIASVDGIPKLWLREQWYDGKYQHYIVENVDLPPQEPPLKPEIKKPRKKK